MILDEGALPPKYREEVMRLMSMIEVATDDAGVRRAGSYAEGFVRGIEVAGALRDQQIEELYVLMEAAMHSRLEILASQ